MSLSFKCHYSVVEEHSLMTHVNSELSNSYCLTVCQADSGQSGGFGIIWDVVALLVVEVILKLSCVEIFSINTC